MNRRERRAAQSSRRSTAPASAAASLEQQIREALRLHQAGRAKEADRLFRRAAKRQPNNAEIYGLYGSLKVQAGHYADAVPLLSHALSLAPRDSLCLGNLAVAYEGLEDLDKAIGTYRRALEIDPSNYRAHANLAPVLWREGCLDEAVGHYREAVALKPDFVEVHISLAHALHFLGHLDDAVASCRRALELDPNAAKAHLNLGRALQAQGDTDAALPHYRRALEADPSLGEAYKSYAYATRAARDDPVIERLRAQLARPAIRAADEVSLRYALGKVHNDLGEYDAAFESWSKGASLKRSAIEFSIDETRAKFASLEAIFTRDLFDRAGRHAPSGPGPIFIVGMPRSGTTLIEQILASHPEVYGGGELRHIGETARAFESWSGGGRAYPEGIPQVADPAFEGAARHYLKQVGPLGGRSRVTDKMPGNFQYLGLIVLMFPHAKIVHCRRNPLDTCVSCFTTDFAYGHEWSYDLPELAAYYGLYSRLMAHWHGVWPERIYEVGYEDVVADLEAMARGLLAYCDLPWDDACLAFHKTERPVMTASNFQVRQKLYATSVGRWRRYEKHLAPLIERLPPEAASRGRVG